MAPAAPAPPREITTKHDALSIIKDQGGVSLYPSDDDLVNLLQGRFRSDLPYTRLGASVLLAVNPLKTLANLNEASANAYAEKDWSSTAPGPRPDRSLQPHIYELAVRVFALANRKHENQAVVFRCEPDSSRLMYKEAPV
jgi:chitin synthase